jgi:hypothetical protein
LASFQQNAWQFFGVEVGPTDETGVGVKLGVSVAPTYSSFNVYAPTSKPLEWITTNQRSKITAVIGKTIFLPNKTLKILFFFFEGIN